jgi:ligand-binding SRPBCC domain-containing protein
VPTFTAEERFPFPPGVVFDFFLRPANALAAAPPDFHLTLLDAPEVVEVHSQVVVLSRRWGMSQRIVTEFVEIEEGIRMIEEQRQGPFRSWRHERRFAAIGEETEVSERIDWEPPGGMLGLWLTAKAIENDLQLAFASRRERILEMLARKG